MTGSAILKLVPNALSAIRLVLAAAFPFLSADSWLPVILCATATEFLDGWLARRWKAVTRLGQRLDPVADKLFVTAVIVTLVRADLFTVGQILAVLARDLMVILGALIALGVGMMGDFADVRPRMTGKVATTFQFALLVVAAAIQSQPPQGLLWATVAASLAAALDYSVYGVLALRRRYLTG